MINFTNKFLGQVIRLISILILRYSPSLQSQFAFIKWIVKKSCRHTKKVPNPLTNALIRIEDKRFFQHKGIDIYSIIRAIFKNTTTSRLEGASTIVQQLIRNITNEREIKLKRKVKEIVFATILDKEFSKDELLLAYFNTYRFNNCIGIFAFCQNENYDLVNISINQAAEIIARFKYPTLHQTNYCKYLKRVRTIEIKTTPNIGFAESERTMQNVTDKILTNILLNDSEVLLIPNSLNRESLVASQ